jgi:hypothetical protein
VKRGQVRTSREINPNLRFVAWFVIVLGDPLSDIVGCGTHDWVLGRIKAGITAEDFNSQSAFLERRIAIQTVFNDVTEEFRASYTIPERGMGQDLIKLPANAIFFRLTRRFPMLPIRLDMSN